MAKPIYDDPKGLASIEAQLVPGEILEALFKAKREGIGVVALAITSRRIIEYLANGHWSISTSLPYNRLWSVELRESSRRDDSRVLIQIYGLPEWRVDFPDAESARRAHHLVVLHACPDALGRPRPGA